MGKPHLGPFLQSPLRDSVAWGQGARVDKRALDSSIQIYETAVEGDLHAYISPVTVDSRRHLVFASKPGIVLGESIAQYFHVPNFLWLERLNANEAGDVQVYSLVIAQDGAVVVDQTAPLLDILVMDYVKIFPIGSGGVVQVHGLSGEDLQALAAASGCRLEEIQVLEESLLARMDIGEPDLPRTLELAEAKELAGVGGASGRIVPYSAAAVAAVAGVLYLTGVFGGDTAASAPVVAEDLMVLEEEPQEALIALQPVAGYAPIAVMQGVFDGLDGIYELEWWHPQGISWDAAQPDSMEVRFGVGANVASRVPPVARVLGYEILESSETGEGSALVTNRIRARLEGVSQRPLRPEFSRLVSDDEQVQKVLDNLQDLTFREWLLEMLQYSSSDYQLGDPVQDEGFSLNGEPAVYRDITLSYGSQDLRTVQAALNVLRVHPLHVESLEMSFDELGFVSAQLHLKIYQEGA